MKTPEQTVSETWAFRFLPGSVLLYVMPRFRRPSLSWSVVVTGVSMGWQGQLHHVVNTSESRWVCIRFERLFRGAGGGPSWILDSCLWGRKAKLTHWETCVVQKIQPWRPVWLWICPLAGLFLSMRWLTALLLSVLWCVLSLAFPRGLGLEHLAVAISSHDDVWLRSGCLLTASLIECSSIPGYNSPVNCPGIFNQC